MTTGVAELPQVCLKPGGLFVMREPQIVTTVLGSCVAVAFHNARLHVSAICHAMLPRPGQGQSAADKDEGQFRFVSDAIPHRAMQFAGRGITPAEVDVKLFGGGNVIGNKERGHAGRGLGSWNVQAARELLEDASFHIRASNVGGDRGRKILSNTSTGDVCHKHLPAGSTKALP